MTAEKTLKKQALMTLKERVVWSNNTYNLDEKLTIYKLRKLYKERKIKNKVRLFNTVNPKKNDPEIYEL